MSSQPQPAHALSTSTGAEPNPRTSHWIQSRAFDLCCILAPSILPAVIVLLFPHWFQQNAEVSLAAWVLLVLCVDVSHVYSTLFRTYLDREEFERRRTLYLIVPLLAWVFGCVLYSTGALLFWRVLAYIAVYHFIRQQYGFMAIYIGKEGRARSALLDRVCIFLATLYPIVFWHTHPREFSWFVEHDFFAIYSPRYSPLISSAVGWFYAAALVLYCLQELRRLYRGEQVSIPKTLLLFGTALSWYVGIVLYNGDLVFTLTNVIAHGIPYIALIWIYERRKAVRGASAAGTFARLFQIRYLWAYLGILIALSFVEEAFWDTLVWRERVALFGGFGKLFEAPSGPVLALIVPLLAVPQITHYVLDGFIWRIRKPDSELKQLELA